MNAKLQLNPEPEPEHEDAEKHGALCSERLDTGDEVARSEVEARAEDLGESRSLEDVKLAEKAQEEKDAGKERQKSVAPYKAFLKPSKLAAFLLAEVKELSKTSNVEQSQLFKLADDFEEMPEKEKRKLLLNAIKGFSELPAKQRAEIVPLVLDMADAGASKETSVLAQNLKAIVVAHPAVMEEGLADEARTVAYQELQKNPQLLLETVTALDEKPRQSLMKTLERADAIPREHKRLIKAAVKPGGYADRLDDIREWVNLALKRRWLFPTLAVLEFIFSLQLGSGLCLGGAPEHRGHACLCTKAEGDVHWLFWDALSALALSAAVAFTGNELAPMLQQLGQDPYGSFLALQAWLSSGSSRFKCVEEEHLPATLGASAAILLFVFQNLWALRGALDLFFFREFFTCSFISFIVFFIFVALRVSTLGALIYAARYVYCETQKIISIASASTSSTSISYGATNTGEP